MFYMTTVIQLIFYQFPLSFRMLRSLSSQLKQSEAAGPRQPPSQILFRNIKKISKQFSTSGWFYYLQNINNYFMRKKSRFNTNLRQFEFNREAETMEKYYGLEGKQEMQDLMEYYKYYTQASISFHPCHFKVMHSHREKKKLLQYKKLKVALQLSKQTFETSSIGNNKHGDPQLTSFHLLSNIILTSYENQESILIRKLKNKLQKEYGPNRHRTIEDLDKRYMFEKKITEPTASIKKEIFRQVRQNTKQNYCSNSIESEKVKITKKRRNNSCNSLMSTTRKQLKSTKTDKKIHRKSNTTLYSPSTSTFQLKDYSNWTKSGNMSLKKSPVTKYSNPKAITNQNQVKMKKQEQINMRIVELKESIKQQKQRLKKKIAGSFTTFQKYSKHPFLTKIKAII